MSEWKEINLGKHINTNKNSIRKDYPYTDILYLDTGSITENHIEKLQEYKLDNAPSRAKRLVEEDDIIYSSVRPNQLHYGFIKNPQDNLVVSTGFVVISCDKGVIIPKYLFYYLSDNFTTEFLHSIAEASTSAYPSLKPSDIESLEINLPPLPEQQAIAEVLSSLDDKIDLLHRQNITLEQMAETLFRQWFVEEAADDWEEGVLGKYVSVIDNRGKTPPNTNEKTDYPLIEVNALGKDTRLVDYSVIRKYVDEETFYSWFRNRPQKYDTLLSTVGSIGAISMYILEVGNVAQNVIGLTAKEISPFYLYQFLKNRTNEILSLDIGGVQPSIKVPHLLSLKMIIPPQNILDLFDNQMTDIVYKIEINYKQIRTLEKMRDTLLPKLMSGEVRATLVAIT